MLDQNTESRDAITIAPPPGSDAARLATINALLGKEAKSIELELEGSTIELTRLGTGGYRVSKLQSQGLSENFVYNAQGAFELSHAYFNSAYGRLADIWVEDAPPSPDKDIGDKLLQILFEQRSALTTTEIVLEKATLPKPPKPVKKVEAEPRHSTSWAQVSRLLQLPLEEENLVREKLKPTESHNQYWVENSVLLEHLGLNTNSPELNILKALALYNISNQSTKATNGDEVLSAWVTLIATEDVQFPTEMIEKLSGELKARIERNDFPGRSAGEKARERSNCLLQTMLLERALGVREQRFSSPLSTSRAVKPS